MFLLHVLIFVIEKLSKLMRINSDLLICDHKSLFKKKHFTNVCLFTLGSGYTISSHEFKDIYFYII